MSNQKGLAPVLIILLIGLCLTVLGGAYYLTTKNKTMPTTDQVINTPSPVKTVNDTTANWITYSNKDAQFTFSYPPDWIKEDFKQEGINGGAKFSGKEGSITFNWGSGFGGGCGSENNVMVQLKDDTVSSCHSVGPDGTESWDLLGKSRDKISVMFGAIANNPHQENRGLILQLLKTVKFTDSVADSANWKTYTNKVDSYPSYQIQYPSDWTISGPFGGQAGYECAYEVQNAWVIEFSKVKPTDCGYVAHTIPSSEIDFTIQTRETEWKAEELVIYDQKTTVAGIPANKFVFTEKSQLPNILATRLAFNYKGKGFVIYIKQSDKKGTIDPTLEKMLATFKFIN